MKVTLAKLGILAAIATALLLFATMRPGVNTPVAEADLGSPGGISALPSAAPGFPGIANQGIPAIIPASDPGRGPANRAVVTVFCSGLGTALLPFLPTPCSEGGGLIDGYGAITFKMTQDYGDGSLASTFTATGSDTLVCTDNAACDLTATWIEVIGDGDGICEGDEICTNYGVVAVEVTGGGENEILKITATDEIGEARTVNIVVVDTILAWGATGAISTASQESPAFISYACDDTGRRNLTILDAIGDFDSDDTAGLDDIFDLLYGAGFGIAILDNNFAGDIDLDLLQCGGDTGGLFDDFVDFQTDKGMFSVDPIAVSIQTSIPDLLLGLGILTPPSLDFDCGEGKNIDTWDVSALAVWGGNFITGDMTEGGCDADFANNGVVTTALMGTGEVGVATIKAQQGGGVSPPRTINVTFVADAVGGIADLPDVAGTSAEKAGASAPGSGFLPRGYAALAGGLAAALLVAATGAWYARRRWLK